MGCTSTTACGGTLPRFLRNKLLSFTHLLCLVRTSLPSVVFRLVLIYIVEEYALCDCAGPADDRNTFRAHVVTNNRDI